MADVYYSVKTALRIGIVDVICGLVSIAVGAFSTRNDDHTVITEFKPKGFPVWTGILFVITGAQGILSYKNPRKSIIIFFMVFSVLCVGGSVIVFWCILPILINGQESIPWNLSYGSFLALTSITFVVSMKAIYLCFKATIMYVCNCVKRRPPREPRQPAVLELGTTYNLTSHGEERSQRRPGRPTPSHRGASGSCRSQRQHSPYNSSDRRRRSRDRYRERSSLHVTQIEQSIERIPLNLTRTVQTSVPIVHVQRPPAPPPPPPPPYPTMKFPYLPSYSEVEATPPPPPYTEK